MPAVDGNVLRILTRVATDDTDIMKQSFRSAVEAQLGEMMRELTVPEELRRALRDENVPGALNPVSYTHLRAHETGRNLVCRLLLEKKKQRKKKTTTKNMIY